MLLMSQSIQLTKGAPCIPQVPSSWNGPLLLHTNVLLVMQDKPRDATVDAGILARQTPGFSGAELSNLVNEAALLAAKTSKTKLSAELLDSARDKAIMGVERK